MHVANKAYQEIYKLVQKYENLTDPNKKSKLEISYLKAKNKKLLNKIYLNSSTSST